MQTNGSIKNVYVLLKGILFLGAIGIAFLASLWFAFSSLFGDNIPNELSPQAGYGFDYIVGELCISTYTSNLDIGILKKI